MPKKKRKFRRINLLETSVVGIPAYPDAHLSYKREAEKTVNTSYEDNTQLNTEQATMEEPNKVPEVVETTPVEEGAVEAKVETVEPVEPTEPAKAEDEAEVVEVEEVDTVEEKNFDRADLKKAISEVLSDFNEERALVERKEVAKETMKAKSLGELAVDLGFFK